MSERKNEITSVVYAAAEVWNSVEDIELMRGAALVVGRIAFPEEDDDVQVWLAEALIHAAREGW